MYTSRVVMRMCMSRSVKKFLEVHLLPYGQITSKLFWRNFGAYWNHAGKRDRISARPPMTSWNIFSGMSGTSSIRESACSGV